MLTDQALWARIEAHSLDDLQSKFPFSQRLARDNGWSHRFALKAIREYKRFVYLTCVSRATLTPSDEVDQVWHLHLTYSRDYWEIFCPQVLGRKLHHGPTKGGLSEDTRFALAYAETKALYQCEFGHEPPLDIWPSATERFGQAPFFRRVDTSRVFMLPKVSLAAGGMVATSAVLAGCSLAVGQLDNDVLIPWGLFVAGALIATIWHLCSVPPKGFWGIVSFLLGLVAATGLGILMLGGGFHRLMSRWPDYPLNAQASTALITFISILILLRMEWLGAKRKPQKSRSDSGCSTSDNSSSSSAGDNDSGGGGSFGGGGSTSSGCGGGCGGD